MYDYLLHTYRLKIFQIEISKFYLLVNFNDGNAEKFQKNLIRLVTIKFKSDCIYSKITPITIYYKGLIFFLFSIICK